MGLAITAMASPTPTGITAQIGKSSLGPTGFDRYRHRYEIERAVNQLKNARAVATRYDKRAYIFHGAVTAAAGRSWLGP